MLVHWATAVCVSELVPLIQTTCCSCKHYCAQHEGTTVLEFGVGIVQPRLLYAVNVCCAEAVVKILLTAPGS